MVKFGRRLAEELIVDGWETNYVQYKLLKKTISRIAAHEVPGEMVEAFEMQEAFLTQLRSDVERVCGFYTANVPIMIEAANIACARATEVFQSSTSVPGSSLSSNLEGADVIEAVVEARRNLEELSQFLLVNREACRKILKKYHKKTSSGTEEMHGLLEQLLLGTPLKDSHETNEANETKRLVSTAITALSDAQAQISLKSVDHAKYMARLVATSSPRPSGSSRGSSRHGPAHDGFTAVEGVNLDSVAVVDDVLLTKEITLRLPCGLTCATQVQVASWWAEPRKRYAYFGMLVVGLVVVGCMVAVVVVQPTRLSRLSVVGTYASALVAIANGANDIANSVGTSVGAKALTLRQAIVLGLIAEVLGAMTLGSLVAKTISKGVVDPETFDAQGCEGVLKFGVSMVCVLCGTGLTTLIATLYGLPISASHGVIGGLIAVGLVSQGPASLGVESIVKTMIAWVASPAIGAFSAAAVYSIILHVVHRSTDPARRAILLQPAFVAVTVAVAAGFIVIKGPDALKVKPVGVGVAASLAIGAAACVLTIGFRCLRSTPLAAKLARSLGPSSGNVASIKRRVHGIFATSPTAAGHAGAHSGAHSGTQTGTRLSGADAARKMEVAEKPFVSLLILSALTVAFAHGANDVGNAVGPLAAIFEATLNGSIAAKPKIPLWTLTIGSAGFVIGIAALGSRTIATVGGKITALTPSKSFSVQIGAAVAVLSSTILGLAVSTSHCLVGSVVGVAIASKVSRAGGSVNMRILLRILIGWGVTIPLAMLVTIVFYFIITPYYGYDAEELLAFNQSANLSCY